MSNNASKYSAEDEQTSKVSARSKSVLLYSAAFLLAELMMLFILKANHFYPFGTKSMLIMDMRDQNVEFLASLRSMIHGDNSLFFSWARSMGGNYMGVFAFYISSPLSFLSVSIASWPEYPSRSIRERSSAKSSSAFSRKRRRRSVPWISWYREPFIPTW